MHESQSLPLLRAIAELLGAINYTAAHIIFLKASEVKQTLFEKHTIKPFSERYAEQISLMEKHKPSSLVDKCGDIPLHSDQIQKQVEDICKGKG
jgi:hypothetical protein